MVQPFPSRFRYLLRIVETRQYEAARQNDNGRDDRTRQWASAGLVQPSDELIATPPGFYFKEVGWLHST
jgi:hypothetical protein